MPFPKHHILRVVACLCALCTLAACDRTEARARDAFSDYQAAAAANDLIGARQALLGLVRIKEDVPDYWAQLGKIQLALGNSDDAYYAFTRAYELDRRNPDLVRAVTQLALQVGDLEQAQAHAEELEVLAPSDPWVQLTKGWAAIGQLRYAEALAASNAILANTPLDANATVLKGRALVGLNRTDEALDLLQKQIASQPSDTGSLQLLSRIYVRQNDWPKAAMTAQRLSGLIPDNQPNKLLLVEASLRSGNFALAREASANILTPEAQPSMIGSVLDLWADFWPSSQRAQDALKFAAQSPALGQKLVYASFLNRINDPADAMRIASPAAGLPVDAENAEANAVLADSWARTGNIKGAKQRFDAVITFDPGNATALRGRAEVELRMGNPKSAVIDAQKLVTVLPSSARDRLLLAKCFVAAGENQWADRTLWTAFQELPGDEKIYYALLASKNGNADVVHDVQEEFARQRDAHLNRGLL
jgi:tetratricopeptide (TPR) repeat protein